jgi:hypothetical protein
MVREEDQDQTTSYPAKRTVLEDTPEQYRTCIKEWMGTYQKILQIVHGADILTLPVQLQLQCQIHPIDLKTRVHQ